jgi:short-subunit dehydrogenase
MTDYETGLTQDGRAPRRVTLITGASGGIGADLARVFARHGHDLALVARSRGKLEALADEIAASGRPRPLPLVFDLIERGAATQIAAALDAAGATPEILVNNAGLASPARPPASILPNSWRSSISIFARSLK